MESELSPSSSIKCSFDRHRHVRFLEMMNEILPGEYQSQEINTVTLAYFVLSSLDIIDALDTINKEAVATWVLSFQARPGNEDGLNSGQFYGFHGSKSSQFNPNVDGVLLCNGSHLASTYCALAILKIVGYDFSLIDSKSIATSMRNLQQHDGSFIPIHIRAEADLRFLFCAAAISYMLDNWSGVDKEKAKEYILNCQSYDGGFGLSPGLESHGGATYCAIASLLLMGFIEDNILSKSASSSIINVPLLLDWIMQDWSSFEDLGGHKFVCSEALRASLLNCQSQYGGFSKFPGQLPELHHSYYGFCAFSLLEEAGLNSLCVELGITYRAAHGN